MTMPIFPVDAILFDFNESEDSIVRAAFTTRGVANKNEGCVRLRATKPFKRVTTAEEGCTNYVWRMLCFDLVGFAPHSCMPVMADCDLYTAQGLSDGFTARYGDEDYEGQRDRRKALTGAMDAVVDRFEKSLPVEAKKGIIRWGKALGMI